MTNIYFSDFFSVPPEIVEEYGAFNVSLNNDLPLFIDPFLLFNSEDETYQGLHVGIIDYMRFLRDISVGGNVAEPLIREWFTFPEIKQNWLGFSTVGNQGRGLGADFAKALDRNLRSVFRDFGDEVVTQSSHLEKLCLIRDGVGRDSVSDFTTNLILEYLAEYTQAFAETNLEAHQYRLVTLRKTKFNYRTRSWMARSFNLPYINDDFVILTPKNILTKDEAWINRPELLDRFPEVAFALPDATLRAQIDDYLRRAIPTEAELSAAERREVMGRAIERFPEVLDYYIRDKEDRGEDAKSTAAARVYEVETVFVENVRALVSGHLDPGGFYQLPYSTHDDALQRALFLKDVIENKGGHTLFYMNGNPIQRERDLHILYRLTWFGTPSDVTREANDGRGPADFKISAGATDKTIVEFKLAKNSQLKRNLEKQCEVYEAASDTTHPSIKIIFYFDDAQLERAVGILRELGLENDRNIILVDACQDNKPSGSKA